LWGLPNVCLGEVTVRYENLGISEAMSREQSRYRNLIRKPVADQGDAGDIQQESF
jgi:DNA-directed RNA polymerase specialized sigma24 family protein